MHGKLTRFSKRTFVTVRILRFLASVRMTKRFPKKERKKINEYKGMMTFFPGKGGKRIGVEVGTGLGPAPESRSDIEDPLVKASESISWVKAEQLLDTDWSGKGWLSPTFVPLKGKK